MKYRRLGNSGLLVSELALGTMTFGEVSGRGVDQADAIRQIHTYLDAGGNHLDIADVYAGGRAEEIVGQALKARPAPAIVATKVRWPTGDGPNHSGLSRYHIEQAVDQSLKRLGTDKIDVLYLHGWDALTPLEETLRAMDDLLRRGKIRYAGVSNFLAWQAMKAIGLSERNGWPRFVAGQYQYSLVARDIDAEFAGFWESEGVGLVPWAPLGGGFLSGRYTPGVRPQASEGRVAGAPDEWEESWTRRDTPQNWRIVETAQKIAAAHPGANVAQVSIAWLLAQPGIASVVIGSRTREQLAGNLAAADLVLSDSEIAELDAVSKVPASYPSRGINFTAR